MAYASVASLMRTIELLLTSHWSTQSLICDHREEFLGLHEKASSLEVFLKNFEKSNVSGEMTDLEVKVKEVANDVEYTIQLRLTETVKGTNKSQKRKARRRFCQSLQRIAGDIDRVLKESTKIQDKGKHASKKSLVQDFSSSAKNILNVKNNMVGRDDQRERLLAELTQYSGLSRQLKVIPIIGMGGIGKTTLAKEVYNDAYLCSHFDVRGWATVSSQHNVKEILLSLLRSTKELDGKFHKKDEGELADMLRKSLMGKRYLIVMDDMWSSKAWDDVRLCFPSENKGSRILLTTRNSEVACSAGTENRSLKMGFMDTDESWNLFQSIVFSNEELPSDEFETIGKQIVDKCEGLPLTVVVVAGFLSKSERTIEDWESVAKDVKSFVTNDPGKQCLHVLGLSYNHLTSNLKACLLYFGFFPEDYKISAKTLVRLWIAEGFLKLEKDLEGEAEKCLQDLVDRCLVLVSEKSMDESKIKSCKVHDLIHELCLREAKRQNIFVMKDIACNDYDSYRALLTPGHHHWIRRQTYDEDNNLLNLTRSLYRTRSLFFLPESYPYRFTLKAGLNHFNLLRILDLSPINCKIFPPEILCLIWLRYLAMYGDFHIPSEICRLWNLQTFIVGSDDWASRNVSETIWELKQLRHLVLARYYLPNRFYLPNPPNVSVGEERHLYFPNIQTISGLSPSSCTKEVISGIWNAKKLRIYGEEDDYESCEESRLLENLVHLHQLEKLSFYGPLQTIPSVKAFPAMLKKLQFEETKLRWEELDIIGEIPNLEVLKLRWYACQGEEWHPIAGGFTRLKLLLIENCDLEYWKATNDNFPVLERLVIKECWYLEEIPIEFAEIDPLQLIELVGCKPELEASAQRIQQEQEELGNKPVDVRISSKSVPLLRKIRMR
ncbi:putative late blight resistance protein homolog R1A-10 isoform X2 [Lycium barbarum]|uniref:putative late blight resistance protein homolog R1A-10 isoform X2 n=1 Tax=Lycium barbarum TaxID=112863 RepID=UPI00293E5616|nr:putative late blight resistance protein homolog R1A-10 isoform X2 [Lycium barbarum]